MQFTKRQIDGRALRKVEVSKDSPLDIELEGGAGTPLGGKLVISEVFAGGAAAKCGKSGQMLWLKSEDCSFLMGLLVRIGQVKYMSFLFRGVV